MRILVAWCSKYGATQGIAERVAARLRAAGDCTDTRPVTAAFSLDTYDAFVIGSAAYIGHWQKEATEFVQGNSAVLAGRPTWLFSSGPLGNEPTNALGLDQRVAAEPKEIAELRTTISPRDHRVFFGALDLAKLGFRDRAIRTLPAGRALLPEGDFRDWRDVDAWADSIAGELAAIAAGGRTAHQTDTEAGS
jgi:menaquinone-dependent protoporphyrinogen oxidase